jgi:hypothetical protein
MSYLNSLNVRRRSEDGAHSRLGEAAVKARPRTGQTTGSQVRYREVVVYAIPRNGFSIAREVPAANW